MLECVTMKRPLVLAVGFVAALTSCQQQEPNVPPVSPVRTTDSAPREAAHARQYLALPGEGAISVGGDTDAAFEQQAAAYASQTHATQGTDPTAFPQTAAEAPFSAATPTPADIPEPSPAAVASATGTETASPPPTAPAFSPAATEADAAATAAANPASAGTAPAQGGLMDYTVRITNGTPGRLFIEAQDAAGTIYPCGFMHQNRSYSTPMVQSAPIHGPITVVVRDPDQPGAPEIRRYRVNPPADYAGKTIDITIIPGGMYQASVDGQIYYRTPPPPGALPAAPAATASPAASAAPSSSAAPIPPANPQLLPHL